MTTEFKNIREIIDFSAEKFAENPAFIVKEKKNGKSEYDNINFARLRNEVRSFGKYLIANGLQGKRIAVIGKNSYKWMLTYLGVLYSGGIIVPPDKGLLDYEIKEQLMRSEAELVFYADHLEEGFAEIENIRKIVFPEVIRAIFQ